MNEHKLIRVQIATFEYDNFSITSRLMMLFPTSKLYR